MRLSSIKSGLAFALASALAAVSSAIDTYDVVIIGSGPGGLVAAEYLSRDPSVRVLVLEAGAPSMQETGGKDVPWYAADKGFTKFDIPGEYDGAASIFNPDNAKYRVDWISDEPSFLGKLVGGCSTINAALYFRTPDSYVSNMKWPFSPERVTAGFDALEEMFGTTDNPSPDQQRHLQEAYKIVAQALSNHGGYREVTINDAAARNNKDKSFGHAPFTFKNGLRDSPAKVSYGRFKNRPNAKLLTFATASYIKQTNGRATGVVYNGNIEVALSERGAVIMGAGALSTPKVLIQSGIGPRRQLEMLWNRADFPGVKQSWVVNENVGKNLFDTNVVFATFSHPDMRAVPRRSSQQWAIDQYKNGQNGVLSTSGPVLIGYENYDVAGRLYEFQTTIIGTGFQEFNSDLSAFMAALYINNPESRDYSSFDNNGKWRAFTDRKIVMSSWRDVDAMKSYTRKVVDMMQRQGAKFLSAKAGESVDAWVDRNKGWKTNHFGGSCYASSDAGDSNRCADDKLRVVGTTNIFVADGSVMRDGTVNPYGFIMYAGYEAGNVVKEHLAGGQPPQPQCGNVNLEVNVDYSGQDIGNAPGARAEDCCAICQSRAGCKAFSWTNFNGGTCWLKSAKGDVKPRDGVISGSMVAPTPTCPNMEEGVDYAGNDVGSEPSASAEGCCTICKNFNGCNAFSWNSFNGGTCWLKSSKGATTNKAGTRSAVVTLSPQPNCPSIEENIDYSGNDIGNEKSSTAEGCCAICRQRVGCKAFSWNKYNDGTCWLKSGKGATTYQPGARSAVLDTSSNIEEDVDYIGNDVGNQRAAKAELCFDACRQRAGCKAFSWNDYNGGTCWLKSGKGAAGSKTGTRSAVVA
ncbi:hypothetical protein ATCC90586_001712 [Pythium insidiosum]|nr:hypothetical protein ATCC90586_001712 [Pythium insidiosum]